ncbi:hypothetical protein FA95DRAFT_901735 [Auriscalpium vulgare]|uniref:Uncharacterized protein n=1 Tax=Auriscalpium vulgare TaxID=40419 RepID=A0ACB8R8K4_9AGAM|nr:hypothetical protein FA95DRAFT_901735 [Auriscalpium vulgare]
MEHHNGAGFLSNALHNLFHRGSSVDPRSVPSGSGATPASDRSGRPSDAMDEDLDSAPAHHEPAPLNSVSQHTHQAMDQDAEMAPLVFAPSDDSRAASAASLPETAQPSETALAAIFDTTSHEVVMPVTAVPSDDMPPLIGDDTRSISSMPSLQSVSDSSSDGGFADHDDYMSDSSRDAADVEMVLDDDGDSAWTDNDDMPPLVDTAGLASAPNSAPHRHTVEVEEVQDPDAAAGGWLFVH